MTFEQVFLIGVVAIPLVLVGLDRLRADVAALVIAVALGMAQYLGMGILSTAHTPQEAIKAFSGLSQPVILTLLGLFVFTRSLERSGVMHWVAHYLIKIGGHSERRLIVLFSSATALMSLVMNNLAAGVLVLPSAMEVARRSGIKPSKLLIPVAYGSLLGGSATYFTTANMIISNLLMAATPPQPPLHILAFVPTGGLMAIVGIAFLALFGWRWLPNREPMPEQLMARLTSRELEEYYRLGERLWEAQVSPDSPLANKPLSESRIGERFGLSVAAVWHGNQAIFAPSPHQVIHPYDILLIVGREDRVSALTEVGMKIGRENSDGQLSERGVSFIEIMPAPHSPVLGHTLRELEFRTRYGFTALAIFRGGRSYRTDVGNFPLMLGDSILLIGSQRHLSRLRKNPNFIVLEPDLGAQVVQRSQAWIAIGVLALVIVASILGWPVHFAMLTGALFLMLTKTIDIEEVYHSIEWQAILLIAGMYSVSLAMVNTGLAQAIGDLMLRMVEPLGPLGLAAGAYLLTALLAQVMGGQVTALVTGPITISAAIAMHTNPQAIAVATAIGCSASFLTPIAHPVNTLMIAPANYQFRDFFNIGWRLTLVCFFTLIIGLIVFWKL